MSGDDPERESETVRVDIALAVPLRDGAVLVARRPADSHLGGQWEFPGGKVEPGESPLAAARRELAEETGLEAAELQPLTLVVHDYAEMPLRFHVFLARNPSGCVRLDRSRPWAWMAPSELAALPMPTANRQMLRALEWRLSGDDSGLAAPPREGPSRPVKPVRDE